MPRPKRPPSQKQRGILYALRMLGRLTGAAAWTLAALGALAQTASFMRSDDNETLQVENSRPVMEAAQALEEKYGWLINYEDPAYLHKSDRVDISDRVERPTRSRSALWVPRGGALRFTYKMSSPGSPDQAEAALKALIAAHETSGLPGKFRLAVKSQGFDIIPVETRKAAAVSTSFRSPLEAPISFPAAERTAMEAIKKVIELAAQASGFKIGLATVPLNLLNQTKVLQSAENETAREVLRSVLASTGRKLAWHLLYDPMSESYFLNVHFVSIRTTDLLTGREKFIPVP